MSHKVIGNLTLSHLFFLTSSGFCGAKTGSLPCIAICSSVTAYGRNMIEEATRFAFEKTGAERIYGDTDSIFIRFPDKTLTLEQVFEKCVKLENDFKEIYPANEDNPNKLEFEKVLVNLLMLQKKKYVSLKYESVSDEGKIDPHGIEVVRRDNAKFLVKLQTDFFERLIRYGDVPGACKIVETYTRRLTSGEVDLGDLVISKKYSKAKYKNVPIHVFLNNKLRRRCAATAYHCGDRIPYIVVSGGAPITERGEDPAYVREHNVPVDLNYYFTNMVEKPMIRLLEQVIGMHQTRTLLGRGKIGAMDRFITRKREVKELSVLEKKPPKKKSKQTTLNF